jgi:hypothetical protein
VAQNTADIGGGIHLSSTITAQIDNSTIALNTANSSAGGLCAVSSPVTAISTVISQNYASTLDQDLSGAILANHCLIGTVGDAPVFNTGGWSLAFN